MLEKILSLSLEKKIGQLFFIGISGTEINDSTLELLEEVAPGGICLFARNIRTAGQVRQMLADLRADLAIEPLLSLDEEGGTVDRLRRILTPLPAAGSLKTSAQAQILGQSTAEIIRILGFNMNFAPVVDVSDDLRKKFSNGLYSRAFGNSKEDVIRLAGAYLTALQNGECLGCLKHFPGLGASEVDSHEELPSVNLTREEFSETDLFPYRELFKSGEVRAVMVAHAAYPRLEWQEKDSGGNFLPASLSYQVVTELLREQLGFEGLAVTDDLEMGAIIKNYGIAAACRLAVNAGQDMLAICAGAEAIREGFRAILGSVKSGEIAEERINLSLERIARIKNLMTPPPLFQTERLEVLSAHIAQLNKQLNYSYGG